MGWTGKRVGWNGTVIVFLHSTIGLFIWPGAICLVTSPFHYLNALMHTLSTSAHHLYPSVYIYIQRFEGIVCLNLA